MPRCSSPTGRQMGQVTGHVMGSGGLEVCGHVQVSAELCVAAGLCRTGLGADPSEPV